MSDQSVSKIVTSPRKRMNRQSASRIVDPDVQTIDAVQKLQKSGNKKGESKVSEVANEENIEEVETLKKPGKKKGKAQANEEQTVEEDPNANKDIVDEVPEMLSIHLRTTPQNFSRVAVSLSAAQKEVVRSYGLGSLIDFQIFDLPSRLVHYVVSNYNPETNKIELEKGKIEVDPKSVEHVFGIPSGNISLTTIQSDPEFVEFSTLWKKQFPQTKKKKGNMQIVSAKMIADVLVESREVDQFFKMNFLMLFMTSVIHCENGGRIDEYILHRVGNKTDLTTLNWSEKVLSYLKKSKKSWKPEKYESYYCGPATFLLLLYLDRTKYDQMLLPRERPVFKNWGRYLKSREALEIENGRFGFMEIRGPMIEESLAIEDYETAMKQLVEVSKKKKMLFEFLNVEFVKEPENKKFKFFQSKISEMFSMKSVFYDEEQTVFENLNKERNNETTGEEGLVVVYEESGKAVNPNHEDDVEKDENVNDPNLISNRPVSSEKQDKVISDSNVATNHRKKFKATDAVEKEANQDVEKEANQDNAANPKDDLVQDPVENETNFVDDGGHARKKQKISYKKNAEKVYEKLPTKRYKRRSQNDNVNEKSVSETSVSAYVDGKYLKKESGKEMTVEQASDKEMTVGSSKETVGHVVKFSPTKNKIHKFNTSFVQENVVKTVPGEVEPKTKRGRPRKATPEVVQEEAKVKRKKSERVTLLKLKKKVITKDGKGLDKKNPVDLK